jgi:hypothetical protein
MQHLINIGYSELRKEYINKPESFRTYFSSLKNFLKKNKISSRNQINTILLDSIKNSNKSLESKKRIFFVLARLFPKNDDKKQQILQYYINTKINIRKDVLDNKPINKKEKQILSDLSLKDFKKHKINLDDISQNALLYNLLVYQKETPRLDYMTLQYNNENADGNILYKDKSNYYIKLGNYKTFKKYGLWKYKLSTNLNKYIKKYITEKDLQHGDYLFTTLGNNHYSKSRFSEYIQNVMKKYVGLHVNINALKKIKLADAVNKPSFKKLSMNKKNEFVIKYFRHNYKMSQSYYMKVKD